MLGRTVVYYGGGTTKNHFMSPQYKKGGSVNTIEKLGKLAIEFAIERRRTEFSNSDEALIAAHYVAYLVKQGKHQDAVDLLCKLDNPEIVRQVAVHIGELIDEEQFALLSRTTMSTIYRTEFENRRLEVAVD